MASDDRFLWTITYAIGEKRYTCPFYFKDREQAEGRIGGILIYASHIKLIDLRECKDGLSWGEQHLPYKRGEKELLLEMDLKIPRKPPHQQTMV